MPLTNLTPATATEILLSGLPYITTLNVLEGGVIKRVYYKITNDLSHDAVITTWFYGIVPSYSNGNYNINYVPDYEGYADVALSITVFDSYPNSACSVPIKMGESYWIEVHQYGTGLTSPILNINISLKPYSNTHSPGEIIIFSASSDSFFDSKGGLHTGIIDATSGQITNFIPFFPSTEGGDILNDGTVLITDNSWITKPDPPGPQDWYLLLYNSSFGLITRILFAGPVTGYTFEPLIKTNNATNKFWVGQTGYSGAPNRYASVSSTGVISAITNFANFTYSSTIRAVAATNNESHLLVIPNHALINNIWKWNLTTLAWDGTIGPVVASAYGQDLLVMQDGTIIIVYTTTDNKNNTIKRYNLAGTELNTVTVTTTVSTTAGPRLGYAADPLYFWFWLPLSDGNSLIKKYKYSDFSVAVNSSIKNVYETSIEVSNPELIYVSDSCPIIELRTSGSNDGSVIPPPVNYSGIYQVKRGKTDDTVYTAVSPQTTEDVKIPDPFVKTGLVGG